MAQTKFVFASVFLVLIFVLEIQCSEGRNIKLGKKNRFLKLQTHTKIFEKETKNIAQHNSNMQGDSINKTACANEPIPTAPAPPTAPGAQSKAVDETRRPPPGHVHDFRPATPGHSPGFRHSTAQSKAVDETRPPPPGHVDDFRPTTPGHSPGVKAVGDTQPPPPGHVDDFRPTTPGHSPGVGHSLQN